MALGFNYRMSEIHAVIGIEQMKKLPGFLEQRLENFKALEDKLTDVKGIQVIPQPINEYFHSSHYCLAVLLDENLVDKRPEIMKRMGDNGIGSSVYYPQPVPRMSFYKEKYGYEEDRYPNATRISDGMMALPVGPHLNTKDMEIIGAELTIIMKEIK